MEVMEVNPVHPGSVPSSELHGEHVFGCACVRACMRACVCVRVHMCAMSLSPVAHVAISLPTCNSPLLHPHATMSDHPILWSKLFLASSPGHHTAGVTLAVGIDSQPCLSAPTVDVLPVSSAVCTNVCPDTRTQ